MSLQHRLCYTVVLCSIHMPDTARLKVPASEMVIGRRVGWTEEGRPRRRTETP